MSTADERVAAAASAEIQRLRAELALSQANEADARRWRWLADETNWTCELNQYSGPRHREYLWATRFSAPLHNENGGLTAAIDAAIDRALGREKGRQFVRNMDGVTMATAADRKANNADPQDDGDLTGKHGPLIERGWDGAINERQEFEAQMLLMGALPVTATAGYFDGIGEFWFERDEKGRYTFSRMQDAWQGWLARAKIISA